MTAAARLGRLGRRLLPACAGLLVLALVPAGARAQTLNEALAAAYQTNPTLKAARDQLRAVNEGVPQELSNTRPSLFVDGQGGIERIDDNVNHTQTNYPWQATLNAEQPLYRGGRTVAGVARAEADVMAQRSRLVSVEQGVMLDAVTAFMDVWRDEAVLQLTRNNERVLTRQLEATRDRFEVGELTRTDVAQSESRLARSTAERIQAEGNLTSSQAVYQQVVGQPPGDLVPPPPLTGLPASEEETITRARSDNPDVVSARFDEESSRHQVKVDQGQLLPEVFAMGELSHSDEFVSSQSHTDVARGVVQVTVPLYQSGLVSSQVRQSKQVAQQRRQLIDEADRRAERLAVQAWESLQTAKAQVRSFTSEVRSAQIALDGVRQENSVGARTVLDVLDAEQELLDAQVNLTRAKRDEVVAAYGVQFAVGRLTARDLELSVVAYDPTKDYEAVRGRWFGLDAPGQAASPQ